MSEYKFENTTGHYLLKQYERAIKDCFEYEGKTLTEWETVSEAQERKEAAKRAKEELAAAKARNIELYREQATEMSQFNEHGHFTGMTGEFDRSNATIDEDAQYRNEMRFAVCTNMDLEEE
jgi:glycyl-tRNA synthetase beta subunit